MQNREDYFLLGTLSKTHGVSGELVLKLNNLDADDIEEMGSVFIEFDGLLVPFFISQCFAKNMNSLVVKFEDIDSSEQAGEFVNCKVFSSEIISGDTDDFLRQIDLLIGFDVIDKQYGNIGKLKEFIDMPNNPLFKVVKGKKELLIPVNDEFILEVDKKNKTILIDAPEGLIDLYI